MEETTKKNKMRVKSDAVKHSVNWIVVMAKGLSSMFLVVC